MLSIKTYDSEVSALSVPPIMSSVGLIAYVSSYDYSATVTSSNTYDEEETSNLSLEPTMGSIAFDVKPYEIT